MEKINSLKDLTKNAILTFGNFDGVHSGHREFLDEVKKNSLEKKCKLVVVTFIPHPRQILSPKEKFLINSYEERRDILEGLHIDYIYEIEFTRDFSTLSPKDFLEQYILVSPFIKGLALGYDFSFGSNKSGSIKFVKEYCKDKDINILIQEEYLNDNSRVSSSEIRKALDSGDVECANKFLERKFYILGTVIKGQGRGRQIGFPTANIFYNKERMIPSRGVYITQTKYAGEIYNSVTNIGFNPTFEDSENINIETHILNFDKDIYGDKIEVLFSKKLRDEKKFNSVDELVKQISIDVKLAEDYFD
jgi:riboflavin kinase/FMN adenylyltransferase